MGQGQNVWSPDAHPPPTDYPWRWSQAIPMNSALIKWLYLPDFFRAPNSTNLISEYPLLGLLSMHMGRKGGFVRGQAVGKCRPSSLASEEVLCPGLASQSNSVVPQQDRGHPHGTKAHLACPRPATRHVFACQCVGSCARRCGCRDCCRCRCEGGHWCGYRCVPDRQRDGHRCAQTGAYMV